MGRMNHGWVWSVGVAVLACGDPLGLPEGYQPSESPPNLDGSGASGGNGAAPHPADDPLSPPSASAGEDGGAGSGGMANPGGDEPPKPGRGTGPGDWGPGDYPPDLRAQTYLEIRGVPGQKGHARQYKVHVPPSYDANVPTPAVFCIHGLLQNAVMLCVDGVGMHEVADEEGFVLIMPNGFQNSWNGGTCCGGASTEELDDVALFRALLDEVGSHVNIDRDRVYATGLSNGGFMSFRLACEAADIFTAIAPVAGAVGTNDIGSVTNPMSNFTLCEPSRPVSVFAIHGIADLIVPYAFHEPSMRHMAIQNGCSTQTTLSPVLPNAGDTACVDYLDCPDGIELKACSVDGGGHCWFGSEDCGTGGGFIGLLFVGANSTTLHSNAAIRGFLRGQSR